jgi:hypothetical protein
MWGGQCLIIAALMMSDGVPAVAAARRGRGAESWRLSRGGTTLRNHDHSRRLSVFQDSPRTTEMEVEFQVRNQENMRVDRFSFYNFN